MLDDNALDIIFRAARTYRSWRDRPVGDGTLKTLYELARWGPTSANCSPMRLVFVKSERAKARLRPCLLEGNVEQTMAAPVTAIVAHDMRFYDRLPELYPEADARAWFVGDDEVIQATAFRNGSLQGAYLMVAARALGLDCGPMSGFDNARVDRTFFPDGQYKSNFLCNLGYGDPDSLSPRGPRLAFDEVCEIA
jgi:3-hydroxypropanoate dehydrogenase